jgi:hypothetical protein
MARRWRAPAALAWACSSLLIAACGGNSNNTGVNSSVGTSSGVAITTETGSALLQAGTTLALTAAVTNDTNSAGVRWVLDGAGSLTSVTSSSATYVAPASVTGTSTPIITATSVADATQVASATLVVSGTPIIDPIPLFPANANTAYAAAITVTGGLAPFTWTLTSGALPAGIVQAGNVTYFESISGTPTVTGTFPFTMQVTDANSATATVDLTLVVNEAATCLLSGQYALMTSGVTNGQIATRAASVNIDSSGNLTGVIDRKQSDATVAALPLTGTCLNRSGNSGQLTLTATGEAPILNFSVNTALTAGRTQLISGSDFASASGPFYKQDPTAFSLTQLAGDFAFGLLGSNGSGVHMGLAGQISVASSGTVTAGRADSNASGSALTAASLTGAMSAPDANGRGTLTLNGGGQSFQLAYYVVSANRLLLVNADSSSSAPRLEGFMTRRAASFTAAALTSPAILSLWGAGTGTQPTAVLSVGLFSGGNATSGSFNLLLDTADRDKIFSSITATSPTYVVEADGRIALNYTASGVSHQLIGYLDGPANGYVIERNSSVGTAGLLEAQVAGPFDRTIPGLFVSGTQSPQSSAPVVLLPAVYVSSGSIASSSATGYAAIDTTIGRGLGTITITGVSTTGMALYEVQPSKVVILRFGTTAQNPAIEWLIN